MRFATWQMEGGSGVEMLKFLKLSLATESSWQMTPVQLQVDDVSVHDWAHAGFPRSCLRVRRAWRSEMEGWEITERGRRARRR